MSQGYTISLAMLLLLGLASCTSVPATGPAPLAAPEPLASATPTAGEACREAVASTAGRSVSDTSVIQIDSSRAGAGVKIGLRGADRPWSCIVGADGVVKNVMYMGEG